MNSSRTMVARRNRPMGSKYTASTLFPRRKNAANPHNTTIMLENSNALMARDPERRLIFCDLPMDMGLIIWIQPIVTGNFQDATGYLKFDTPHFSISGFMGVMMRDCYLEQSGW